MSKDEFSIALSYYHLFTRNANSRQKCSESTTKSRIVQDDNDKNETLETSSNMTKENESQDFWVEDVWTTSDEETAKETLNRHMERCNITYGSNIAPPVGLQEEEEEDANAWDQFYTNHGTRFFKDRHYLSTTFPEEFTSTTTCQEDREIKNPQVLVEIGCGVGNALLPLLQVDDDNDRIWDVIHGLDISKQAIHLLQQDPRFIAFNETGHTKNPPRSVHGHVCDISKTIPNCCVRISNVTTLLFCLSAIDPEDMLIAVKHVASTLKPGGKVLFRDYGRHDEAQMKLGTSRYKQIKDNFYRKHDGTKCFYFTLDDVERLFVSNGGLQIIELKYLRRVYHNKATGQKRRRVWVQGRFQRTNVG